MPKKKFTTVTPLPSGVSREIVLETLWDHLEMIDLNPTHSTRHRIPAPSTATPEEFHCNWYEITDRISMCPGLPLKSVSFNACFHDLANGSQIHCYAPLGLDIKQKWTVGGNAPGEPIQPTEIGIGAPIVGLYIREDVELKCNILVARFVRRTLKDALKTLVARLLIKAQLIEAAANNRRLQEMQALQSSPQISSQRLSVMSAKTTPTSPYMSVGNLTPSFPHYERNSQLLSPQSMYRPGTSPQSHNNVLPDKLHPSQNPVELP